MEERGDMEVMAQLSEASVAYQFPVGAVFDILADGNAVYEYRACPPHDEEREALIMAVKSWLDRHPNSLNRRASAVTAQALAETYPCAP